ncbi:integrase core domain-containing protein [Komagataeibacter sp. FNDCR2]|uniref:integrase core domain-containing protein n=1 Tax=Komagataeibacter sp. FNDCR2 TaxID=2878682 RepID=UPI00351D9F9A
MKRLQLLLGRESRSRTGSSRMHLLRNLIHARSVIDIWRAGYNAVRPHTSLNGITPTGHTTTHRPQLGSEGTLGAGSDHTNDPADNPTVIHTS